MAAIKATANFVGFDYLSATELQEIRRNLDCLYSTPSGTCPGDRAFGLNQDFVGLTPIEVARNKVALEIIEKTTLYEPRVAVLDIEYDTSEDGGILARILLGPAEDREDEDEDDGTGERDE